MVSAPGGSHMMQDIQTAGCGSSGFGVTLAGFFSPNIDMPARLQELEAKHGNQFSDIAQVEVNGYTMFLAYKKEASAIPAVAFVATFRREPHKFFQDLPRFLYSTRAQQIDRMLLSSSLGAFSLTILYRPVNSDVS